MNEVEVKVIGIDCEKLKEKIILFKGELIKKEFQENHIFSLPENINESGYIRIRVIKDQLNNKDKVLLCIKKVLSKETDSVRKMDEKELEVNNFNEAYGFLKALNIKFINQENKYRESYKLNNTLIEFDTWDENVFPYTYAEIEAENESELYKVVNLLEIPRDKITSKGLIQIKKEMGI